MQYITDKSGSILLCYNIVDPYVRSFCKGTFLFGGSADCIISVDGVTCNSCSECTDATGKTGQVWDCSNTVAALLGTGMGSHCEGDELIPFLDPQDLPPSHAMAVLEPKGLAALLTTVAVAAALAHYFA